MTSSTAATATHNLIDDLAEIIGCIKDVRTDISELTEQQERTITAAQNALEGLLITFDEAILPGAAQVAADATINNLQPLKDEHQSVFDDVNNQLETIGSFSQEVRSLSERVRIFDAEGCAEVETVKTALLEGGEGLKSALAAAKIGMEGTQNICEFYIETLNSTRDRTLSFKTAVGGENSNSRKIIIKFRKFISVYLGLCGNSKARFIEMKALDVPEQLHKIQIKFQDVAKSLREVTAHKLQNAFIGTKLISLIEKSSGQKPMRDILVGSISGIGIAHLGIALTGVGSLAAAAFTTVGAFMGPLVPQAYTKSLTSFRITQYLFNKNEKQVTPPTIENPVQAHFFPYTTGIWNGWKGKIGSTTEGRVDILLSENREIYTCNFNLNLQEGNKVADSDLNDLIAKMIHLINGSQDNATSYTRHCLRVLELLGSYILERAASDGGNVIGLIDRTTLLVKGFETHYKTRLLHSLYDKIISHVFIPPES